jgi:hypothetical protein
MISGVNSTSPDTTGISGQQTLSITLDSSQMDKFTQALNDAGIDPNTVTNSPDQSRESVGAADWRQIFNGIAMTPSVAPPKTGAASAAVTQAAEEPAPSFPFKPNFEDATLYGNNGTHYALNSVYFASPETAQWMADKYGTGEVFNVKVGGESPGMYAADKDYLCFETPDGTLQNAGLVASYLDRMPEDQFPGVADAMIRDILARGA